MVDAGNCNNCDGVETTGCDELGVDSPSDFFSTNWTSPDFLTMTAEDTTADIRFWVTVNKFLAE